MTTQTASASGTFRLGDLDVHRLGFGAMRLTGAGIWGPPDDREEALRVLRTAVHELDVNLLDTADSYGPFVSEELIAEALFPYPEGLVIATKGGLERPGPGVWERNGDPRHLRAACEGSLRRLRLDRIDVYQLHAPDRAVPIEDSLGELVRLRDEGKIRHVAVSNFDVERLERARRVTPIVSVQNRYNLADRGADAVVAWCEQHDVGFIPWRPVAGGVVASERAEAIARRHDATATQIALAWLLHRSPVILPIPGTSTVEHLKENVEAAAIRLSEADVEELQRAR
jgi:aryl-alcohol dehydrogenase-like predicted oxidoreductase